MNTMILDPRQKYNDYLLGNIGLPLILDFTNIDNFSIVNFIIDNSLRIKIKHISKVKNNLGQINDYCQIALKYNSVTFAKKTFHAICTGTQVYNFYNLFANDINGINNLSYRIYAEYEKLFGDLGIYYYDYFQDQILEGNIHLKIEKPIMFTAINDITSLHDNTWFLCFNNIASPIIHVTISYGKLDTFVAKLLNYKNNSLEYLFVTIFPYNGMENYVAKNNLYEKFRKNFPALSLINIGNMHLLHNSSVSRKIISLAKNVYYSFSRTSSESLNSMQKNYYAKMTN
jgi:hypothetical protein